jgi:hypothetical protein
MTRWLVGVFGILALAGAVLLVLGTRQSTSLQTATEVAAPVAEAPPSARHSSAPPESALVTDHSELADSTDAAAVTIARAGLAPAVAPPVPETAESSSLAPLTILENMRTTIRQYGLAYAGNPVGNNAEITAALQGENPKQINFLKPDGNRVNASGELVDPWGTPYFFHQLSAQQTEIRSAGPDRTMYTADDLVTR